MPFDGASTVPYDASRGSSIDIKFQRQYFSCLEVNGFKTDTGGGLGDLRLLVTTKGHLGLATISIQ